MIRSIAVSAALLSFTTPAGADKPKPDKAKTLKIGAEGADYELIRGFSSDCDAEYPNGTKFVEPSKAVWVEKPNDWSLAWKGETPEGHTFEVTMLVNKDNSGTYQTDHKKIVCKKRR
jgi:hypothetical protein